MRNGGGEALILAELVPHDLGPTAGVFPGRRDPLVVLQHARQAGPAAFIRTDQPWKVGHANAENVCHGNLHNTRNRLRLFRSAQPLWHIIDLRSILPKWAVRTMNVHSFPPPPGAGAMHFQELEQAFAGDPGSPYTIRPAHWSGSLRC